MINTKLSDIGVISIEENYNELIFCCSSESKNNPDLKMLNSI